MSKSGLFAHFGSKEELQLATVDHAAAMFVQEVDRAGARGAHGVARVWALSRPHDRVLRAAGLPGRLLLRVRRVRVQPPARPGARPHPRQPRLLDVLPGARRSSRRRTSASSTGASAAGELGLPARRARPGGERPVPALPRRHVFDRSRRAIRERLEASVRNGRASAGRVPRRQHRGQTRVSRHASRICAGSTPSSSVRGPRRSRRSRPAERASPLRRPDNVEAFLDSAGSARACARRADRRRRRLELQLPARAGRGRYVLRRPPRPPLPPSAHDMVREARLQLALAKQGIRVPPIVAVGEDESVLGRALLRHGVRRRHRRPRRASACSSGDAEARRAVMLDLVDTLADIHAVDVDCARPAAVRAARQLPRAPGAALAAALGRQRDARAARARARRARRRRSPGAAAERRRHGDYRIGNVIVADRCATHRRRGARLGDGRDRRPARRRRLPRRDLHGTGGLPTALGTRRPPRRGFRPAPSCSPLRERTGRPVERLRWSRRWRGEGTISARPSTAATRGASSARRRRRRGSRRACRAWSRPRSRHSTGTRREDRAGRAAGLDDRIVTPGSPPRRAPRCSAASRGGRRRATASS